MTGLRKVFELYWHFPLVVTLNSVYASSTLNFNPLGSHRRHEMDLAREKLTEEAIVRTVVLAFIEIASYHGAKLFKDAL